jgi:hypothetical protein
MRSITSISEVIDRADGPRLIELLSFVVSWSIHPNDPTTYKRQQDALDIIARVSKPGAMEQGGSAEARRFLHSCQEDPRAERF